MGHLVTFEAETIVLLKIFDDLSPAKILLTWESMAHTSGLLGDRQQDAKNCGIETFSQS